MSTLYPKKNCQKARPFYYDFLGWEENRQIPDQIALHVHQCHYCQDQIERLEQSLDRENCLRLSSDLPLINLAKTLKNHFALANHWVSCGIIKAFLPGLVLAPKTLHIPTPVMAHIEHCPACANDFAALQGCDLKPHQFRNLTCLLYSQEESFLELCSQTISAFPALNDLNFHDVDPDILDHIHTCKTCRHTLYEARLARLDLMEKPSCPPSVGCLPLSSADLFDLVFPYLSENNDDYATPNPTNEHVRHCPVCFKKMLDFSDMLYTLIEREDSGIITRFKIKTGENISVENLLVDHLEASFAVEVGQIDKNRSFLEKSIARDLSGESSEFDSTIIAYPPLDNAPSEPTVLSDETADDDDMCCIPLGPMPTREKTVSAGKKHWKSRLAAAVVMIAAVSAIAIINLPAKAGNFREVISAINNMTWFSYVKIDRDGTASQYWRSFDPPAFMAKEADGTILYSFGEPEQTWRYDPQTNTIQISSPLPKQSYLKPAANLSEYMEKYFWHTNCRDVKSLMDDSINGMPTEIFTFYDKHNHQVTVWCDLNTHLPIKTKNKHSEFIMQFPQKSSVMPSDIYELGVPQDAVILKK